MATLPNDLATFLGLPKFDLATFPNDLAPPNEENTLPNREHFGGAFAYIKGNFENYAQISVLKEFLKEF